MWVLVRRKSHIFIERECFSSFGWGWFSHCFILSSSANLISFNSASSIASISKFCNTFQISDLIKLKPLFAMAFEQGKSKKARCVAMSLAPLPFYIIDKTSLLLTLYHLNLSFALLFPSCSIPYKHECSGTTTWEWSKWASQIICSFVAISTCSSFTWRDGCSFILFLQSC